MVSYYRTHGFSSLIRAFFISFYVQFAIVTLNYLILTALSGHSVSYFSFFCLVPIIGIIQGIPVSFGGWGIGEAAYSVFFSIVGISSDFSVSASLVMKVILILMGLAGLPFYIIHKPAKIEKLKFDSGG